MFKRALQGVSSFGNIPALRQPWQQQHQPCRGVFNRFPHLLSCRQQQVVVCGVANKRSCYQLSLNRPVNVCTNARQVVVTSIRFSNTNKKMSRDPASDQLGDYKKTVKVSCGHLHFSFPIVYLRIITRERD